MTAFRNILAIIAVAVLGQTCTAGEATLTTAAQIRALSFLDGERRIPVRLRGVVTVVGPANVMYFQDDTGGVLVMPQRGRPTFYPGDFVELDGVAVYGQLVPRVAALTLRKVAESALPHPARLSSDDFSAGRRISEWVEIEGVVRSASLGTEGRASLHVDLGARTIEAMLIRASLDECLPLVDARVRVRGVVAGYVTEYRQIAELYVRVNSVADVEVVEPAITDPFTIPITATADMMLFSSSGHTGHRIKLRGTLLGQRYGEEIYLRDGAHTVVVHTRQRDIFAPGDILEVVGFPEMGPVSPRLHDSIFRRVAPGPLPEPRVVSAEKLWQGQLDGELVTLAVELTDVAVARGETLLVFAAGDSLLRARMCTPTTEPVPWRVGSALSVTGVCRIESTQKPREGIRMVARDVELWLRNPKDVLIMRAAPWWTIEKLAMAVVVVASIAVVAFAWIVLLRRRVRAQTEILRNKIQQESIAEERHRIAREFHDTVEQELAGLAVRLDHLRLKVADSAAGPLASALQRLARSLQDEARHFIWNLHEHRWDDTTLSEALADAVAERYRDSQVDVRFVTEGSARRLPDVAGHHLMRIGQEAVTNAIQHAAAKTVEVQIRYDTAVVAVTIRDDGCGFEPEKVIGRRAGHFGLSGMSERARRIGATLTLHSKLGQGTTIEVLLPFGTADFI